MRLLKVLLPPDWLYLESKAVGVAAGIARKILQRGRADGEGRPVIDRVASARSVVACYCGITPYPSAFPPPCPCFPRHYLDVGDFKKQ